MRFDRYVLLLLMILSVTSAKAGDASGPKPDQELARYKIVQLSNSGSFMIDTQTGKIWRSGCLIENRSDKDGKSPKDECALTGWKTDLVADIDISKGELESLKKSMALPK